MVRFIEKRCKVTGSVPIYQTKRKKIAKKTWNVDEKS